jgi:hypothetical protein
MTLLICVLAAPAPAADLARIERSISYQPAYHQAPRYCLLAFGPEAKTRVWLVVDGDTLYVDRNGDGNLIGQAKQIAATKQEERQVFVGGDIREGALTHHDFKVIRSAYGYQLTIQIEMPPTPGQPLAPMRIEQTTGLVQFAERPRDAPIIHFNGPRTLHVGRSLIVAPGQRRELSAGVGTPGLGEGTFAFVSNSGGAIPEGARALAKIAFPAKDPTRPITATFALAGRC